MAATGSDASGDDMARAHWMAGPGRAFFDHLGEQYFQLVFDEMHFSDDQLDAAIGSFEQVRQASTNDAYTAAYPLLGPLQLAILLCDKLSAELWSPDQTTPYTPSHLAVFEKILGAHALSHLLDDTSPFIDDMRRYTFFGRAVPIMADAFRSVVYTTLNTIGIALLRQGPNTRLEVRSLEDVAQIIRQPWFRQVSGALASPHNGGVLRLFSVRPIAEMAADINLAGELSPILDTLLNFTWQVEDGEVKFALSPNALQRIAALRGAHNRTAKGTDASAQSGGTSSGCPANGTTPIPVLRGDHDQYHDQYHEIARILGTSVEDVRARRAQSGINDSLDALADFLERAGRRVP